MSPQWFELVHEPLAPVAAPLPTRVRCGWCDGTGRVPDWSTGHYRGERNCVRCVGTGFVVTEGAHD